MIDLKNHRFGVGVAKATGSALSCNTAKQHMYINMHEIDELEWEDKERNAIDGGD